MAMGVAVLVLATCGAVWWRSHPDQPFTGSYGMGTKRHVGHPVWTVLVHWSEVDATGVTIRSIEPEFGVNTSDAKVEYILCELPEPINKDGVYESFGYGMHARRVDRFCISTRPAEGADMKLWADKREELLVGVTPTRPGRTLIKSHRVSFDDGWQRGRDEVGVEIKVVTPETR
jgi:hypothetical protein